MAMVVGGCVGGRSRFISTGFVTHTHNHTHTQPLPSRIHQLYFGRDGPESAEGERELQASIASFSQVLGPRHELVVETRELLEGLQNPEAAAEPEVEIVLEEQVKLDEVELNEHLNMGYMDVMSDLNRVQNQRVKVCPPRVSLFVCLFVCMFSPLVCSFVCVSLSARLFVCLSPLVCSFVCGPSSVRLSVHF